ncbi:TOMM precursor leader peptide-binding protein [Bradyrhizobium sp. McL0616]|uniref:TOMM precursor leader peptide-binding protein n=1 Tax=Bradyrhizobium sp. McL0616 TaxID=3415674 RepID=UPI003CF5D635
MEPIVVSGDGLFLLSEGGHAWMPSPVYAALAPLLDGTHTIEDIFTAISDIYPIQQVFGALDRLRTGGYLAEDAADLARPAKAFWEHFGVLPSVSHARLERARVSIEALGDTDIDFLATLLKRHGVTVAPDGDLTVVVTDDYLRPGLEKRNIKSLADKKPWLLLKPVGMQTWNGPAFVPGQTGCWECLAQRLRGHRRLERYIVQRKGADAPMSALPAFLPSSQHAALAEAATEIVRWIATKQSSLLDRVVSTSVATLERVFHPLTRRPQCPACGTPDPDHDFRPIRLRERSKVLWSDGGHRACEPGKTMKDLERHLSPITGIVSRIVPGERTGEACKDESCVTPTFATDHNFSDMHDERFFLREGLRLRSGGKGKSVEQARMSALAESLERYCGVFDGTEPRVRASFASLGKAAIHPNACMGYSERQYAERESNNRRGHKAHWVPQPFQEDVEIEWSSLWSLTAEAMRYLPTSLCYYGYLSTDPVFARGDSNGCAAGSVFEEAVLQGILELVERDAVAIWWYNRLRRPAVDLESVDDPYVPLITNHYRKLRRDIWVLDVTNDLRIPTFVAISRRVDTAEEDIIYGFGAHLDPGIALTRALTEMNQSLEAVPTVTDRSYRGSKDSVYWWRTVKAADSPYLMPSLETGPLRPRDFKNLASDDLYEDIITCKKLLAAAGIEILVLDQTRPDVGLPVVRVVAPGLRHIWARFGAGRLYDVPAREGWLSRPLAEEELNSFVIQF